MAIVELRNVTKEYVRGGVPVRVIDNVALDIEEGDFVALMGPSGSGKSSLLNLLAGLDVQTAGTVRVAGADVAAQSAREMSDWRARHIGFVFQQYNLIPVLSALDNVELPLLLTPLSRAERREHARTALRIVGLADRESHFPRQLSGGQEQRVSIARAIVTDPTLILADEPTGNLDARAAEEVMDLLDRLNVEFGKTIVMVTHDPRAAHRARRTLHLEKGVLVEEGAAVARAGGPA